MWLYNFSAVNAPFNEVLDRLRSELAKFDSSHRRLNIYVSAKTHPQGHLTFNFDKVNIGEALRYICVASGYKYRVEKWGVVIY